MRKNKNDEMYEKIESEESGRIRFWETILAACAMALYSIVSSGDNPTVLSIISKAVWFSIVLGIANLILRVLSFSVLESVRKHHFFSKYPDGKSKKVYGFIRFITYVLIIAVIIYSGWHIWSINLKNNEEETDDGTPVTLSLYVEKDGDLTYIMDDEETYDISSYIMVNDCDGTHMLTPDTPLTVTIPYTITIVNAMRFDEEMQTYTDSETIYDTFHAEETELYAPYTFNPLVYSYDDNPPHNEPLDITFRYTVIGKIEDKANES